METTTTRRPGRYARTIISPANPSRHLIEISAGPNGSSYGAVEKGEIRLLPAATAACHTWPNLRIVAR